MHVSAGDSCAVPVRPFPALSFILAADVQLWLDAWAGVETCWR